MSGLTDLFKSERGLYALALVAASTVLTALGHMTMQAWQDFNLYVFGIYVGGKSLTGAVGLYKGTLGKVDEKPEPAPTPAPAPTPTPTPTEPPTT